uniref:Uncharacterized protein n=1 Tax=Anguilla anguilla TaxID=7936 RepID=A0A0E9T7F3_ANGAN
MPRRLKLSHSWGTQEANCVSVCMVNKLGRRSSHSVWSDSSFPLCKPGGVQSHPQKGPNVGAGFVLVQH